jgi:glycosyltransferase involved in cell wall biosynthesis
MLSILIPEYNYDCSILVSKLAEQCVKECIPFEVLVLDDASSQFLEENTAITKLTGCQFIKSSQNLKAAKIRNRLGEMASFPNLLFLDCDLEMLDEDFIHRYVTAIGKAPVLVGAVVYQLQKPPVSQMLRWKYGRKRECLPVEIRNTNPWKSLPSSNFMMAKSVFEQVPFDEDFDQYGHEDTLFGLTLKKKGIQVLYIDNPLIHNGLESSEAFLSKSLTAVEKYVTMPVMQSPEVVEQIRIFKVYQLVASLKLGRLLAFKFRILEKCMHRNLCGAHPNLFIFDFYRLGYLCNLVRKMEHSCPEA